MTQTFPVRVWFIGRDDMRDQRHSASPPIPVCPCLSGSQAADRKRSGTNRRLFSFSIWAALLLWWSQPAHAAVYQWTTPQGVIGFTDDPGRIPPEYRAGAIPYHGTMAETSSLSTVGAPAETTRTDAPTAMPNQPPSVAVDLNGHDQSWWHEQIRLLKEQQTEALNQKKTVEEQFNQLNYFGRATVEDRQHQQELRQQLDELTETLAKIDERLTRDLPDEARKAGAPPGWLRE